MKYEKCISCHHIGVKCDGPNFIAMEGKGLMEWCRRRKIYLGLSNKELAELSNVPIGTVDRLFAGNYENFRYSTVRPILQVLVGNEWGDHPCVDPRSLHDADVLECVNSLHQLAAQHQSGLHKLTRLLLVSVAINVVLFACLFLI